MSLEFEVSKDVLIPRQDTEILVQTTIELIDELGIKDPRILEIGTGSGCIAISLAHYIENASLIAIDISDAALKLAKLNAKRLGISEKIDFVKHSVFDSIESLIGSGKFDVLVSNPPYISSREIKSLSIEVKDHEPRLALDGGDDGLAFYRRLAEISPSCVVKGGLISVEVGYNQAKDVAALLGNARIFKDLSGIDRVAAMVI